EAGGLELRGQPAGVPAIDADDPGLGLGRDVGQDPLLVGAVAGREPDPAGRGPDVVRHVIPAGPGGEVRRRQPERRPAVVAAPGGPVAGWLVAFLAAGLTLGDWGLAVPALSAYVAAALAYSAVFVPLGYLFSRALIPGLAYVFVWEGILATVVSGLSASSVWRIALSIYADLRSE